MVNGGPRGGFAIRHYAAEVIYDVDGWLDKNKDSLTSEAYTVSPLLRLTRWRQTDNLHLSGSRVIPAASTFLCRVTFGY